MLIGIDTVLCNVWFFSTASFVSGLVNLSCPDDHDVAFQNFRMLQGLGAALAFGLSAVVCIPVKLYIIISLLILSIISYALAEYRLRRELGGLADSVG